ncbi:acyltransferase [Roseovarius spongiae]|uniref:Acyltransferase n=1 Tax=Roseovarius spongiae TaxID=2320272 RepID=A0A3A8B9T0_9RHOB|nr:acyltransferase [Roseovarius spongiae]RKF15115.1 acyltransferase [Roseovarius spongiae]
MSRGFSTYLDLLRFGAALVVLLSHFGYARYSGGRWLWVRELNLGSDAVVVFFVLSGLVIALVADRKRTGGRGFAFDRLTRLWSVALPALAIGFALDRIGAAVAPAAYAGWFYAPLPFWEQMLRGLSFSNEWGGLAARLGTNGPFWSLSYEAAFYTLFAVAFYLRGARRLALLALGIWIAGLNVLLLMPAWLMGVALHHCVRRGALPSGAAALALALLPVLGYAGALAVGAPDALRALSAPLDKAVNLRFSDEPLWNALLGVLVTAHLAGMAGLLREQSLARLAPRAAWLAGGSFSLYLMHYPALQFVSATMPRTGVALLDDAVLLVTVLAFCALFAALFERPLPQLRAALRRVTARLRRDPARGPRDWPDAPPSAPAR